MAGSRFASSGIAADVQAAADDLATTAASLQAINQDRLIEASLAMEWLDLQADAPLCGVVSGIGGVEVPLGVNAGSSARYPRIVARTFDVASQQLILTLDTDRQLPVT